MAMLNSRGDNPSPWITPRATYSMLLGPTAERRHAGRLRQRRCFLVKPHVHVPPGELMRKALASSCEPCM